MVALSAQQSSRVAVLGEAVSHKKTALNGGLWGFLFCAFFFYFKEHPPTSSRNLIKQHLENVNPSLILFWQNISIEPSIPFQPDRGLLMIIFFWIKSRLLPLRISNSLKTRMLTHIASNLLKKRLTWSWWQLPSLPFGTNWPGHTKE